MTSEGLIDRAGLVLLGALAPAAALTVDPTGWYPFGPAKWLAVSVLGLAGAAGVLARRPIAVPRTLGRLLLAWVAWLAVAAAVGLDPVYAWVGTPERHLGVLTWALCAVLLAAGTALARPASGPTAPTTVIGGAVVASVGIGGVALAEALGWEPAALDVGTRLTGTFGSAAYLGAATALLLPVCAGAAVDRGLPRSLRIPAGGATLLLLVATIGSGARAAWAGLALATAVTAWARQRWLATHSRRALGAAAAGALALAVVPPAVAPATSSCRPASMPPRPGRR